MPFLPVSSTMQSFTLWPRNRAPEQLFYPVEIWTAHPFSNPEAYSQGIEGRRFDPGSKSSVLWQKGAKIRPSDARGGKPFR